MISGEVSIYREINLEDINLITGHHNKYGEAESAYIRLCFLSGESQSPIDNIHYVHDGTLQRHAQENGPAYGRFLQDTDHFNHETIQTIGVDIAFKSCCSGLSALEFTIPEDSLGEMNRGSPGSRAEAGVGNLNGGIETVLMLVLVILLSDPTRSSCATRKCQIRKAPPLAQYRGDLGRYKRLL